MFKQQAFNIGHCSATRGHAKSRAIDYALQAKTAREYQEAVDRDDFKERIVCVSKGTCHIVQGFIGGLLSKVIVTRKSKSND